ncbi:MAG: UDP-3-O-acyl-N-acetylglucosamine deacetylase [Chlamydiales bacterium]|nr:UDP-3-O-acyl-N-acetylglucosamine deacetylase [Chlamydiales bacterium]MCH9635763.1 UDP-3-O-acyl-N-acetylglucosamine deacetylase [Chlamydiales bacterium]MCH9703896.1 UDP-3-O-acyl-N-acetylglucosamine deacetylase [Chlamydiota bacterium]
MEKRSQRTLKRPVSYSGIGIHKGKKVSMRFVPAPANSGICFKRTDLPGHPTIPANLEYVQQTDRSTTIGIGDCQVHTVEHVLAPLHACGIDNLVIEVSDMEPPVGDGSSLPFLAMIKEAGIEELDELVQILPLETAIHLTKGRTHIVALPCDTFKISYTLHYPQVPIIKCQYHTLDVNAQSFEKELAPCRTFALYEEISFLMERGLIRGGSLENAVVIKDDVVISKEGLRFADEMVRHKILDVVGDLMLVGFPFTAHIVAICSGHETNVQMGRLLMDAICEKVG